MNVLLLTKYGPKAASCRYRFLQYLPYLSRENIHCTVSPLFDDHYLEHKFRTGRSSFWRAGMALAARIKTLLNASTFDLVVLHCEVFPYLPPVVETFLLRWSGVPYVYDYDDAIFHNYDLHHIGLVRRLLRHKIPRVIAGGIHVLAGNEYLASFARTYNRSVEVLPTVIDMERYVPISASKGEGPFTVGWIGTPSTAPYLQYVAPALRHFCESRKARVILIGSGPMDLAGVHAEVEEWSKETEIQDIQRIDVGIMPLPDAPWERGKSGFKLIQYMGCGLPVVASPVGVNGEIVEHGVNGFLAESQEDWERALFTLMDDAELRGRMGREGRRKAERFYSLQVTAPRLAKVLIALAAHRL